MNSSDGAPKVRLCHLRKKPGSTEGFGFNLHAEKGKVGQFIGKVDPGSPAALAGLKEGDRIIEVNGTNISNENHQQVVERIKSVPDETKFLVVDAEADEYYKQNKMVIRGDMETVLTIVSPLGDDDRPDKDKSFKPSVRLCHLKIWSDFPGYGFNLHAEKGKSAQFIGKVDDNSPAEYAGLKEKDRIIKVNNEFVLSETHQEVVRRIKSDPNQVKLLVISPETEEYFSNNGISLSGDLPDIEMITCPEENPHKTLLNNENSHDDDAVHLRLCHLKIWSDFAGYGFNLHAEKEKSGQFIGKVDDHSPADVGGLKEGDKILKVNGESILNDSHEETVNKIKRDANQVKLLVAEKDVDEDRLKRVLQLDDDYPHITLISCPDTNPRSAITIEAASHTDDADHKLRLCHIRASPVGGFGFNMQSEKNRPGQFIGVVDSHSPAEKAGLKQGDRIIEVNGENIEGKTHKEVVEKIKAMPNETNLLVVDSEAEKYFKEKGIVMCSTTIAHVVKCESELTNGAPNHVEEGIAEKLHDNAPPSYDDHVTEQRVEEVKEILEEGQEHKSDVVNGDHRDEIAKVAVAAKLADDDSNVADEIAEVVKKAEKDEDEKRKAEEAKRDLSLSLNQTPSTDFYSNKTSSEKAKPLESPKSPVVISGIEFAASAEEARRKMSKKRSVRDSGMSMKDKYEMFQKM